MVFGHGFDSRLVHYRGVYTNRYLVGAKFIFCTVREVIDDSHLIIPDIDGVNKHVNETGLKELVFYIAVFEHREPVVNFFAVKLRLFYFV